MSRRRPIAEDNRHLVGHRHRLTMASVSSPMQPIDLPAVQLQMHEKCIRDVRQWKYLGCALRQNTKDRQQGVTVVCAGCGTRLEYDRWESTMRYTLWWYGLRSPSNSAPSISRQTQSHTTVTVSVRTASTFSRSRSSCRPTGLTC